MVGLRVVVAAGMTAGTDALGDFIFMVRELQVRAAAVDVESITEQVFTMAGIQYAQPGRPLPQGLSPCRPACFGRFPQYKIKRIAFETVHFHTLACAQVIQRFTRQLAVSRKLAHGVVTSPFAAGYALPF